jgi:sugar phosphate isomerase/epimerase
MLTVPFLGESMETVLDFAEAADILGLEIAATPGSSHLDPAKFTKTKAKALLEAVDSRGLTITALAYYDPTYTQPRRTKSWQAHARKTIDAAAMLKVDTVCILPPLPAKDLSKLETIRDVLPGILKPVLQHARQKKVRLAFENYFATCLQGLDTFVAMFEAIPDKNLGLNYDPSHLYHQQCDHIEPLSLFRDRLFHIHAKDTLVDRAMRGQVGVLGGGWWRYVIPGFGNIDWGEFVTHLRINGYDGTLSIEHEDTTQTREEGFMRGADHLAQFC